MAATAPELPWPGVAVEQDVPALASACAVQVLPEQLLLAVALA
jgi:hypothetical protein